MKLKEKDNLDIQQWVKDRIKQEEIDRYLKKGIDFIDDGAIDMKLKENRNPDKNRIKDILAKSLSIKTLTLDETAALLNVEDPQLMGAMEEAGAQVKKKVYDNRIVTFAPFYTGSFCVNSCLYCGFRRENGLINRKLLSLDEIRTETEVLAGKIGHKRIIAVYGEHPLSDADYIVDTLRTIYSVKVKTHRGYGQIRRVNVNASPMNIEDLRLLRGAGIGTYQVFQETYNHKMYSKVHPRGTVKADYRWRLYCMHRAFEAGIDDVGIGALFGLYDWRFEVMGLLCHARELEGRFGIGPHTVSFPRIEPASNAPYVQDTSYRVNDINFKRLVTVIRLAIPYTGMIITAREPETIRRSVIPLGCTQTDASSCISIGGYSENHGAQVESNQQFTLGDTRTLDEVIGEFAARGQIVSFCTAGYRCGRTGKKIMDLLKSGKEGVFCKLNAILTFREWLDDFASEKTRQSGTRVIDSELNEVKTKYPLMYLPLRDYYERISKGERDLYF
ncbi:MAG: [FeFe] hydrogenase H-cluster radical SAM maturase HydG [Patescibacteria group bacterium]|nr:[FeFe] hydrogenase H-cluster radical SAM maturase HydG [Patescibacteria group bacterium]